MEIFIDNLNGEMSYRLKLQCIPSFTKLIENGIQVEEACVKKGTLKFYKEQTHQTTITRTTPTLTNLDFGLETKMKATMKHMIPNLSNQCSHYLEILKTRKILKMLIQMLTHMHQTLIKDNSTQTTPTILKAKT